MIRLVIWKIKKRSLRRLTYLSLITIAILTQILQQLVFTHRFRYDTSRYNTIIRDEGQNKILEENASNMTIVNQECLSLVEPIELTTTPIWIPSYPGSGAELFRALVKAATGLGGSDFYFQNRCRNNTVTCKTHWPSIPYLRKLSPAVRKDQFHDKAIYLIRNPRNALPSYLNYKWEANNKLKGHSAQAPETEWQQWRDKSFKTEIENWRNMIYAWEEEEPYEIAFYLQYEKLTNEETGPDLFQQVVREIQQLPGVLLHAALDEKDTIACIWYQIVKGTTKTKRASHKYKPSYTTLQKNQMLTMLNQMVQDFENNSQLVDILRSYIEDITNNTPVDFVHLLNPANGTVYH